MFTSTLVSLKPNISRLICDLVSQWEVDNYLDLTNIEEKDCLRVIFCL